SRGRGNAYREVGTIVEDHKPELPGKTDPQLREAKVLQMVEVEDAIGGNGKSQRDKQKITYLVDRDSSLIYSVRWLEPDDATDQGSGRPVKGQEVRVDFSDWRQVGG